MNDIFIRSLLDKEYSLRARFIPAFIITFPATLSLVLALNSNISYKEYPILHYFFLFGIPFLLVYRVRKRGQEIQSVLWKEWGGNPSSLLLIGKNAAFSNGQRKELLRILAKKFGRKDIKNPERINIDNMESIIFRLIELNRANGLLLEENITYGFWRNLYAVRLEFAIYSLTGIIVAIGSYYFINGNLSFLLLYLSFSLLYWIGVSILSTKAKIKDTAFNYSKALLKSIYKLEEEIK
ncbi:MULTISPECIES: hypothetical protein [Leptospira]|uniref:Uncharacterized protein n=1 Tax=Leptospira licerasiae str. MMD4847 TaxID=1049971 RepID=A0ABN0HA78_9LEPT|nr:MULTISPECIES: hypothetical protein [Leptospira]EIE01403.1 hypothetical protein LEP1GSC185_3446 [Leptospira licerasiae serovar Varillal str. VAR 010]EJZ42572.1 hypothetical protein LEP1GSC178_3059 [Leptospira licerasiae str. MMD4847]